MYERISSLLQLKPLFKGNFITITELGQGLAHQLQLEPALAQAELKLYFVSETIEWTEFLNVLKVKNSLAERLMRLAMAHDLPSTLTLSRSFKPQFLKHTSLTGKRFPVQKVAMFQLGKQEVVLLKFESTEEIDLFVCDLKTKSKLTAIRYQEKRIEEMSQRRDRRPERRQSQWGGQRPVRTQQAKVREANRTWLDSIPSRPQTGKQQSPSFIFEGNQEDQYLAKQRKRLTSTFQVFKNLGVQASVKLASAYASRVRSRTLNQLNPDSFVQSASVKPAKVQQSQGEPEPSKLQSVYRKLSSMRNQNVRLTKEYNILTRKEQEGDEPHQVEEPQTKQSKDPRRKEIVSTVPITNFSYCQSEGQHLVALANTKNEVGVYALRQELSRLKFDRQCAVRLKSALVDLFMLESRVSGRVNLITVNIGETNESHTTVQIYQLNPIGKSFQVEAEPLFRRTVSFPANASFQPGFGLVLFSFFGNFALVSQGGSGESHYELALIKTVQSPKRAKLYYPFCCVAYDSFHRKVYCGTLDGHVLELSPVTCVPTQESKPHNALIKAIVQIEDKGLLVVGVQQAKPKVGSALLVMTKSNLTVIASVKVAEEAEEPLSGIYLWGKTVLTYGYSMRSFEWQEDSRQSHSRKSLMRRVGQPIVEPKSRFRKAVYREDRLYLQSEDSVVKVYQTGQLKLLGKLILGLDDGMISYAASEDIRVYAASFENGVTTVRNSRTDQTYEEHPFALQNLTFLPSDCEFLLLGTTGKGAIVLLPSRVRTKKSAGHKQLRFGQFPISAVSLRDKLLCLADQNNTLFMLQLPLFSTKYVLDLNDRPGAMRGVCSLQMTRDCLIATLESGTTHWLTPSDGSALASCFHSYDLAEQCRLATDLGLVVVQRELVVVILLKEGKSWKSPCRIKLQGMQEQDPIGLSEDGAGIVHLWLQEQGVAEIDLHRCEVTRFFEYPQLKERARSKKNPFSIRIN